jgi:hypothetical protein
MSLKNQAEGLAVRLAVLKERGRRQHDARALDHRRKEWRELWSGLEAAINQLDWMGLKQVGLEEHRSQVSTARGLILRAEEALSAGADNAALTEGGAWAKLQKAINKTVEVLKEAVGIGWKQLVRDAGEFRAPEAIETSLPMSRPGNRATMAAYREAYGAYSRLRRQQAPNGPEDVVRLRELAERLAETVSQFNFEQLPEAVRLFFAAIDSGQGAPLRLLTREVHEWLDEQEQLDKFVVKSFG